MSVEALYALQNGFMGAQRAVLFYGEFSGEPLTGWLSAVYQGTSHWGPC